MSEPRDREISDLPAPHPDPLTSLGLPPDDWAGDLAHYQRLASPTDLHPTESNVALARHLVFRLVHRLLARGQRPNRELITALKNHVGMLPVALVQRAYLRDILEHVQLPQDWWVPALAIELIGFATELERSALFSEALVNVALACRCYQGRMDTPAFVHAGLLTGRLHRRLGNWVEATRAYSAAQAAARQIDDPVSALKATNGLIATLAWRGNLLEAGALAEQTIAQSPIGLLRPIVAITHSMLAAVRDRQGRLEEAVAAAYRAVSWQPDPEERMHALADLGSLLARVGNEAGARRALEVVVRRSGLWLTRTNAQIELMALEVGAGNELNFRSAVRALAPLQNRMPPSMAVDYRVQAASGWERFGVPAAAEALLGQALAIAEATQLGQWIFRVEASLKRLADSTSGGGLGTQAAEVPPAASRTSPVGPG